MLLCSGFNCNSLFIGSINLWYVSCQFWNVRICSPVQCPVPSVDGHYLYAKFEPRPCTSSLALPILHCCTYCRVILSAGLYRHCCNGLPGPRYLAPGQRLLWDMKNANFLVYYLRPLPQLFCTLNHFLELPWKFGDNCPTHSRVFSEQTDRQTDR